MLQERVDERQSCVTYSNLRALLCDKVDLYRDKPWLIFYSDSIGRTEWSYGEFYERVSAMVRFLYSAGIGKADRVATVAYNHADTVVHYFAAWTIGAVVVPINLGEDDKRIGYMLANSRAKLAFVREPFVPRIETVVAAENVATRIVPVGADRGTGVSPASSSVDTPAPALSPDDEALIVYTSGTTGLPKGVVLTHGNLLVDAQQIAEWHEMTLDQRMMCVLPIHHVNGTVVTLVTPMYYGGSVVLNEKFHSDRFFERIAAEKVHVVSVVPTLLQFLLHEDLDMSRYELEHIRHIICGAGPLTSELALKFEDRFGIPIVHGYGLSETTCYSCFLPLDLSDDQRRRWLGEFGLPSIGVPLPVNEMAILDLAGRELPEGVRGEIVIRGRNVMKEYYGDEAANLAAFAGDWFHSGDEGFYRMDERQRKFFFITGRIKELIIRGGTNFSPFEIDAVLMNVPGVKTGLAVGFDNDWYGEEIGAYVQPLTGAAVTEADVIAHCRQHFSYQKCPKVVVFGNDVPVTSTGKYQRNKLKPLFAQWKSVQFTERSGANPQ
jgi:long-chain acyl-CoA synthetase